MSSSKTCPECGEGFTTRQPSAVFCSRACKTAAANLEATRGKQLYRLAYGWRAKGSGVKFSDLSWLVDQFIKEDRERGRPAPPMSRGDMHSTATAFHTFADARRHKAARARAVAEDASPEGSEG